MRFFSRKKPRGRSIEEAEPKVMKIYCKKAGRKDKNGNKKFTAV